MFELCTIRPVTYEDLPKLLSWRNHPSVRRFMLNQHAISLEEHRNWYAKANKDSTRRLFIVEEAHSPIGYVQFSNVIVGGDALWGFYACPDAPKGSGKKLGITALDHAFKELQLHKVFGQAIDTNEVSIAFHKSLGFKEVDALPNQPRIDDAKHSLICFRLLAHDWLTSDKAKEHTHANY